MTGSAVADARVQRPAPRQELVVIVVYMVGLYMTTAEGTIVYTALPAIARDFHAGIATAEWVTLAYLLSLAVFVPSSGWIGRVRPERGAAGQPTRRRSSWRRRRR
jgi:MFS family permease